MVIPLRLWSGNLSDGESSVHITCPLLFRNLTIFASIAPRPAPAGRAVGAASASAKARPKNKANRNVFSRVISRTDKANAQY